MVLASCISLAMDSPDLNDETPLKRGLWYSDIVFASFFSAECLVKVITPSPNLVSDHLTGEHMDSYAQLLVSFFYTECLGIVQFC